MRRCGVWTRRAALGAAALSLVATAGTPAAAASPPAAGTATGLTATRLAAPGGSLRMTSPVDVNRRGEAIGFGVASDGSQRSLLWDGHRLTAPPPLTEGGTPYFSAINDRGQIAGIDIASDGTRRLVVWDRGRPRELDVPDPYVAIDINDRGQVLASTNGSGDVLYDRGRVLPITAPEPADPLMTYASWLNDRGQVLGNAHHLVNQGFLWRDGGVSEYLSTPGGAEDGSTALALNDRGQVVATSYVPSVGASVPFLWDDGTVTPLAGPEGSACWVSSHDQVLNNRGDVIGACTLAGGGGYHGVLWIDGQPTNLGAATTARAVNDRREVTGWSTAEDGGDRAFLWRQGQLLDLGVPEGPEGPAGYEDSYGSLISERGHVLGTATRPDGTSDAFLWTTR